MIRHIFAVSGWPLLVALPLAVNAWLVVSFGWPLLVAFVVCFFSAAGFVFALEQIAPRVEAWLEQDGQLPNDLMFTFTTNVVVNSVVAVAVESMTVVGMVWLAGVFSADAPWSPWPQQWPYFAQLLFATAVSETMRYWGHRWSHTKSLFWQFHVLHHSAERLTVLNLGRIHPGEILPLILVVVAIAVLQIPKEMVYWQAAFGNYIALIAHSNLKLATGPLDYVFNTPNLHRWHHSNKIHECNHNYCHALCFADLLFATYHNPNGRVPVKLGVPMPTPTNFLKQLAYPFVSRRRGRIISTQRNCS